MHADIAAQAGWRRDRWWALGLSFAALVLYVATLAPSVATVFDDSLEFQVVLPSLGIAHPTGYPLYTLAGWLFSRLPIGDWAFRVNLFSAICGAATVGVLFLVARQLGSSRLAAATMSAIFAVSATWWSQATIAEVYTLHGLFVALILYLTLSGNGTRQPWLAFVFGLSLAHHRMTLLLAPAVLVYLLWTDPGILRRPRQILVLVGAFLLPLLLYAYLPLRGMAMTSLDGTYTNTWQGFWRHVLASDYGAFLAGNPLNVQRPRTYTLDLLASQMGLASLLLGLIGLLRWREQPRRWTFLALVFLANVIFAANYSTADVDVFYIPAIMVWLLVASSGLTMLLDALSAWLAATGRRLHLPGPSRVWLGATQLLVALVVLWQPLQTTVDTLEREVRPQTCAETLAVGETLAFNPNRNQAWNAVNCAQAILSEPLPPQSTIIGLLGETTLLRYFQLAHRLRPDVKLIAADGEVERLAAVDAEIAAGHTVYLTRELAGLPLRYSLAAVGPLIRVLPAGGATVEASLSSSLRPVDVSFGASIRLVGFDFSPVAARGANWLRIQAAWQAKTPIKEELKVSARLVAPDGSVVASTDAVPVHWAYPTIAWRPGETVIDAYDFALPTGVAIERLTPLIILYRAADGTEVGRYQPPTSFD